MLKKITFVGLLFVASQAVSAQAVMNKLSKASCECIEKKVAASSTPLSMEEAMQVCVMEAMTGNLEEFMKEYGNVMQDEKKMQEFGTQLGLKLMTDCPAFAKLAANSGKSGSFVGTTQIASTSLSEVTGNIEKFEAGKGLPLLVVNCGGVKENFVVLERFAGSELIFGKEKELKGKKISVGYKEIELYNASKKTFEKQKVIASVKTL